MNPMQRFLMMMTLMSAPEDAAGTGGAVDVDDALVADDGVDVDDAPVDAPEPDSVIADRLAAAEARARKAEQAAEQLRRAKQQEEDAKLSELERVRKEADAIKATLEAERSRFKEERINMALRSAAAELNLRDPDVFLRLVDRSGIEADDDGKILGALEAVQKLKASQPILFGPAMPDTSDPSSGQRKASDKAGAGNDNATPEQKGRATMRAFYAGRRKKI